RGATWVGPDRYEVQPTARRYEDWEFPYALVLGLGAAAEYANSVGVETAGRRAIMLAARLRKHLAAIPGIQVLDRGRELCAIVTAQIEGCDARNLASAMRERGVNAGATLGWYGLLDLGERHVETALRLAPHYYNTEAEIDTAA